MELIFSKHAVEQMIKRNITPDEVEELITHPDGELAQSRDKMILYKRFSKRNDNLIAVVAISKLNHVSEIITVMHYFEVRK